MAGRIVQKFLRDLLIVVQGTQTPAGDSGNVETPQRAARGGSTSPRESKVPGTEINSPINGPTKIG
jgi:hypothetical protein